MTIEPPSPAIIRSPTSAVSRNGPFRLTREHLVPELLGDALRIGVRRRDPGVVDEHVDAAELVVGRVDERVDLVPVADVAAVRERAPTEAPDLRRGLVARVLLPARDDDVRAGLRERAQDRATEAPRATGDQGDAAA